MNLGKTLLERLGGTPEHPDVNAVLGTPETVGEITVVPITEMIVGFGTGIDSETPDPEEAGGGRTRTRPIATIEVGPEGTRVHPIVDTQRVTLAGILLSVWVLGWIGLVLQTLLGRDT
jgi:uncharacterized spore protein YtfJ